MACNTTDSNYPPQPLLHCIVRAAIIPSIKQGAYVTLGAVLMDRKGLD